MMCILRRSNSHKNCINYAVVQKLAVKFHISQCKHNSGVAANHFTHTTNLPAVLFAFILHFFHVFLIPFQQSLLLRAVSQNSSKRHF